MTRTVDVTAEDEDEACEVADNEEPVTMSWPTQVGEWTLTRTNGVEHSDALKVVTPVAA